MTTWITICDTCKRDGWDAERDAETDGERLAALIERAASDARRENPPRILHHGL